MTVIWCARELGEGLGKTCASADQHAAAAAPIGVLAQEIACPEARAPEIRVPEVRVLEDRARIGARENPGPTTVWSAQIDVLRARKVGIKAIAVEVKSLQVVRVLHAAVDHKSRHHPSGDFG